MPAPVATLDERKDGRCWREGRQVRGAGHEPAEALTGGASGELESRFDLPGVFFNSCCEHGEPAASRHRVTDRPIGQDLFGISRDLWRVPSADQGSPAIWVFMVGVLWMDSTHRWRNSPSRARLVRPAMVKRLKDLKKRVAKLEKALQFRTEDWYSACRYTNFRDARPPFLAGGPEVGHCHAAHQGHARGDVSSRGDPPGSFL
jgi:hypothetical protein